MCKKLAQCVQNSLPILADVADLITTWSPSDASGFLADGAVLLCVTRIDTHDDRGPFRFVLGWPRSAGEMPRSWVDYDKDAGLD